MSQLPRFLLLNGPRPACHALTKLICESTLATLVTYMDLADPLHNAAASIFFDNNPLNMGLEESDFWLKPLPFTDQLAYANPLTFEQWIQLEKSRMREDFGADILGRIFHRT